MFRTLLAPLAIGLVCFLATAQADVVTDWNTVLLDAIRVDRTAPPRASRAMAMVHVAIYDAVNAIDGTHEVYQVDATAPADASREAAAAAAAHSVLVALFPAQTATFDAALAMSLAAIPDGQSKTSGIALGQFVGAEIVARRSTDHANEIVEYTPGTSLGDWQPTLPGLLAALLPNWPNVTPFAMRSGSEFRPSGPPALSSPEYAAAFIEVKALGALNSARRSAEQTEVALFWADGPGTATPPGHWNVIAQGVAAIQGNTLSENARLFALLNIAVADAAIVSWDCKYIYNSWRPITAIRQADTDGNILTVADPLWEPLLITPPFPEYTSGHSTFSSAAATILASFFGTDHISFTTSTDDFPGVLRSFNSFSQAAQEAGRSRIYAGIHFEFGNQDALSSGRALGEYVYQNYLRPVPDLSALPMLGGVLVAFRWRRRRQGK